MHRIILWFAKTSLRTVSSFIPLKTGTVSWIKIRKKMNPYNREHNMFLRNFFKGTAELSLDNNNRLLIPKRLMDLIGAERDVVLAGQDGRIEIWAAECL